LILTKDGSAGLLTYKGDGERFTLNHHACVLKPKQEWKKRVHLQWFAHQYQTTFFAVATSKSDNKVFSTEWFNRLRFVVPPYKYQLDQWKGLEKLVNLRAEIHNATNNLAHLLSSPLKIDATDVEDRPELNLFDEPQVNEDSAEDSED
jgi:hypothetical protein